MELTGSVLQALYKHEVLSHKTGWCDNPLEPEKIAWHFRDTESGAKSLGLLGNFFLGILWNGWLPCAHPFKTWHGTYSMGWWTSLFTTGYGVFARFHVRKWHFLTSFFSTEDFAAHRSGVKSQSRGSHSWSTPKACHCLRGVSWVMVDPQSSPLYQVMVYWMVWGYHDDLGNLPMPVESGHGKEPGEGSRPRFGLGDDQKPRT